ncbi:hypothetical protein APR03_003778 [Promicromonospora thailandica]|uniref:Uncharacterized protein n=1 Tax=Promicromonospora thailandica TaxID=765201 RepID=A0A9X2G6R7_9MICO|nr:hypothetical protein [Promicromonospora thailandica]
MNPVRAGRDRRLPLTIAIVVGAIVIVAVPFVFTLAVAFASASDCGPMFFGTCSSASPWWVSAKFFLSALILASVPVAAGHAGWKWSSSWGYGSVGLFVLGILVFFAPTP